MGEFCKKTILKKENIFVLCRSIFFLLALFLFSCTPKKEIVYYQDIENKTFTGKDNNYEIKIQPDDLLTINVSADDPEAVIPFNIGASSSAASATSGNVGTQQSYLVDSSGFIHFPILGKLKVGGLTRTELLTMFENKLSSYIKNPIVNLKIINFKISIQGEVTMPGVYNINSERITLIEALSLAHDLTIYGKRDNILIIRDINGEKTYNRVDITKTDFINSQFYYLSQNDVIYVEPNKARINGSGVGPSAGLYLSIASFLLTITTVVISLVR